MGKFAVIGLGNFGSTVAKVLFELGHELIVLDQEEDLVNAANKFCTVGLIGQATDKSLLASLHVKILDAVFVSLGHQVADSILVTLHLKDLEAKRVVAKIISEDHGRILQKVGADDIVFPERDMAVSVANHVASPTIMNYLAISPEYSIQEVVPKPDFIGQTLAEARIRADYSVNVIGVRDMTEDKITLNPPANFVIKGSDILLVIGARDDMARLTGGSGA